MKPETVSYAAYKRLSNRLWKLKNPEKVKEGLERWKANNPEKANEYNKRWRERNPEAVAIIKERARLKAVVPPTPGTCDHCGTDFSGRKGMRFCCPNCKKAHHKKKKKLGQW